MDENMMSACRAFFRDFMTPSFFKALCDPQRLSIFCELILKGDAVTVSEIAELCPIDVSVVSRHLKMLQLSGVVERTKQGKQVFYKARIGSLVTTLRQIADFLEAYEEKND